LFEMHAFLHGQVVKLLQQWCRVVVSTDAVENGLQTAFTLKAMPLQCRHYVHYTRPIFIPV